MTPLLALLAVGPPRLALVVAVDAYRFLSQAASPDRRLSGANNDANAMGALLRDAGFATKTLPQEAATQAAVLQGLDALAKGARAGSDVCFYFSGLGAVGQGGEPMLVTANSAKDRAALDVPMSRVEHMAQQAKEKGAHVTIVIDACFCNPFDSRDAHEARIYKPLPRFLLRNGAPTARTQLYKGPGVFLNPTVAYEWRQNAEATSWTGAFTDYLVGAGDDALLTRRLPKVRELMREMGDYFRTLVRPDYLPDMSVAVPTGATDIGYAEPFLVSGDLTPLPSDRERAAKRRLDAMREREHTLRVALRVGDAEPLDTKEALRGRLIDFKTSLEAIEGVKLAAMGEPAVDRVIDVTSSRDGLTAVMQARTAIARRSQTPYSGSRPEDVLAAGLGSDLRLGVLIKRLWNLAAKAPETATWNPSMVNRTVVSGERIHFDFSIESGGYLYAMSQDVGERDIDLILPNLIEAPYFTPGTHRAPTIFKNKGGATPGVSELLTLFVPGTAQDLPGIPHYNGSSYAEGTRTLRGPLIDHLDALLKRLETPGAVFGAKRLEYEIPPKG